MEHLKYVWLVYEGDSLYGIFSTEEKTIIARKEIDNGHKC
jgi:hypothetical protein